MTDTRLQGTIISLHRSASKYGGSYGEILCDDEHYVFSGSNIFRNMSYPEVGAIVTFEVMAFSYATNIDRVDKHGKK